MDVPLISFIKMVWEVFFIMEEAVGSGRLRAHSIVISAREKVMVTGVNDVDSFNESEVILLTDGGTLTIIGEDLHISKLNLDDGQLALEGVIDAMEYGDVATGKRPIFGKLFR